MEPSSGSSSPGEGHGGDATRNASPPATTQEVRPASSKTPVDFGDPTELPDREIRREPTHLDRVRAQLAITLVALLAIILIIAWLSAVVRPSEAGTLKDFASVTVPPLVGLVGAVTGFYFGSHRR